MASVKRHVEEHKPAPPQAAQENAPEQDGRQRAALSAQSNAAYLKGLVCYERKDYGCARVEWERAKQLNPSHPNVAAALERLDREADY